MFFYEDAPKIPAFFDEEAPKSIFLFMEKKRKKDTLPEKRQKGGSQGSLDFLWGKFHGRG